MTMLAEDRDPGILIAGGFNTNKPAAFGSTVSVAGLVNSGTTTGSKSNVMDQTTATLTLTAAQSGSVILIDKTDGVTITLPAPVVGLNFRFLYVVDQASSATVITTDAGTTFVKGGINVLVVNSATSRGFVGNGSSHVKVTSNATTTGGLAGGSLDARCITATQWSIDGQLVGSSTPATPFSA